MSTLPVNSGPGLSDHEAAIRLAAEGGNELPRADHRTLLRIVVGVIREPMFALLLGAGVIYLFLGDLQEGLLLFAFATISSAIAVIQENRSEKVLDALRDLTSPRALVMRSGTRKRIAGREVVRGDLLVLSEGDRVPADALLHSAHDLQMDESLITGESVPVRKLAGPAPATNVRPGGDDLPVVFSGTMVVRGHGIAHVLATGARSEIGKIGAALIAIESEPTQLTLQTRHFVKVAAIAGIAVSGTFALIDALARGSWLNGLLGGIALTMAMLPEEFPLVLTVFTVMGAWRISRARVLTRRAATIETLGAATVLCTDKTGTLTQNRMSIVEMRVGKTVFKTEPAEPPPAEIAGLIACGVLASAANPFDPMDKAFHQLDVDSGTRIASMTLIKEYGLRPDLLAVTQVWRATARTDAVVAAKGAPEAIADLCRLDAAQREALHADTAEMAEQGMRVLGIARAAWHGDALPDSPRGFNFQFLGLAGLADPLRPEVPEAVRQCRSAGVRVIMITGDHPATARAIARQAGLTADAAVIGPEIKKMDDTAVATCVRTASVFARILPEQKLRIVNALKANGEIVAMTGDGVNDGPSLKAAHIGIAMGGRGTDVAREAAGLVLLDDDFGSIVRAIRLGRRIYDNIRKAMAYILAVHIPIAGLSLLPLLLGLPLIFAPAHIAFLEMVIDPACSIAFEAETEESDVMRRPPRNPAARLFSRPLVVWSLLQGITVFAVIGAIFLGALWREMPENEARALTFVSLVFANFILIFVNRSFSASLRAAILRPNPALLGIILAAGTVLATTLIWSPAKMLFEFGPLHWDDLSASFAAGFAVLGALELVKWRFGSSLSR